ncbi:glycosyltransferase, family 2 [Gottschalkia acidurici 9a]|uniref:Glycosyltransferase, family 2 n=1 Tax=Gottschalkia acidurici (strain ATCC 7906 / DSM 604 / BCRC 14475 / CIP 104303 / KCTC 5404 / NCIMB 10678 / 9a) TaxID=1128398 RepID=K0AYU1_GOTA9|nr:glycosyltransferase family 2 protein [Gottschalkia acidurici]AFS78409.1 glycosyltransferase, family 2 [Gottschalkia acidurici 9a]
MSNSKNGKVVVVIPAYNEEKTIKRTIDNVKSIDMIDEIVVVDDGSIDNTSKVVEDMNITLIRLNKNSGKGYAIRKAIETIKYDYLVLLDGDLGESSNEVEKLINPVINNEVDVTIAKFGKAKKKGGFGLVKKLAKYGVYFYTGKKIDTTLSGQRVYKKEVIEGISYIPDRFGIEVAMTVGAFRKGFTVKEVDVLMTHNETGRNISGFIHRGRQFLDIFKTLIQLSYKR